MLLRQQRRRHQHRDLRPGLDRHEGGAHGDFGLAEADITADHAVHRPGRLHVVEHLADSLGLIGGFLEGKAVGEGLVLEFAAPSGAAWWAARRACRSSSSAATSRTASAARRRARAHWSVPSLCSGAALGRAAGVAADQMQRVHRHVDAVAVAVFQHQELIALARDLHGLQADVAPDAVGVVHHRCARIEALQIAQDGRRVRGGGTPAPPLLSRPRAKQLRLAQQQQRRLRSVPGRRRLPPPGSRAPHPHRRIAARIAPRAGGAHGRRASRQ